MAGPPIILGDYTNLSSGSIKGRLGRTSAKTGQRGAARMSIEIVSEPLVHDFDEIALGRGPAEAIAKVQRQEVEAIQEPVSDRTLETRKYQEAAYQRGASWAMKRFGGGRLGDMPPRPGEQRKFNHSGRFAKSIVATENRTEKSWTVNVAANRLDPRTSRDAGEFAFITAALRRLAPSIGDPASLARNPVVIAAIRDSINDLIVQASKLNERLRADRLRAALGVLGTLARGAVAVTFE